jgi:hypothetical protein
MAGPKLFAQVTIAGEYKNLARSTRGATKELNIFEKNAKKISMAVSAAFAGIALAGINALTDGLVNMAKAAATDRQSMALLNKTLEQNWGATEQTIAGVDDYITSISYMTGIVDDDLRPAFGKIARVTKTAGSAQKAFGRVLDISAGTGKDVNLVAQAYSKYLGGNKTALDKLIPGLKDAGNRMGFIDDKYKGLAAVAGNNDPFAKINVAIGEFQEKIGTALLPFVDKLSAWLTSPEATAQMNKFAKAVGNMFDYFQSPEGQQSLQDFLDKVLAIGKAVTDLVGQLEKLKPFFDFLNFLGEDRVSKRFGTPETSSTPFSQVFGNPNEVKRQNVQPITQYITVNGVVSGNDAVKAIRGLATQKGQTILKLLGG